MISWTCTLNIVVQFQCTGTSNANNIFSLLHCSSRLMLLQIISNRFSIFEKKHGSELPSKNLIEKMVYVPYYRKMSIIFYGATRKTSPVQNSSRYEKTLNVKQRGIGKTGDDERRIKMDLRPRKVRKERKRVKEKVETTNAKPQRSLNYQNE